MNEAHVHSLARNNTSFISEHDSIALLNSESSPDTSLAISTSPSSAPLTTQSPDSSQSTDYAQALRDPVPSLDAGNVPKIGNTSSRRRRNSRTVHYLSKPQLYLCILWTVISTHPPPQQTPETTSPTSQVRACKLQIPYERIRTSKGPRPS